MVAPMDVVLPPYILAEVLRSKVVFSKESGVLDELNPPSLNLSF